MKNWGWLVVTILVLLYLSKKKEGRGEYFTQPKFGMKEEAPLARPLYPDEMPGWVGVPIRRDREGNIIAW